MNPSNEYVEKFVEDVDLSKVLTAGHIMKRAETVRADKGPRVALTRTDLNDVSVFHQCDSIADSQRFIKIMGNENNRFAY